MRKGGRGRGDVFTTLVSHLCSRAILLDLPPLLLLFLYVLISFRRLRPNPCWTALISPRSGFGNIFFLNVKRNAPLLLHSKKGCTRFFYLSERPSSSIMANFFKVPSFAYRRTLLFCPQEEEEEKSIFGARIMSGVCLGKKRGEIIILPKRRQSFFGMGTRRGHTLGLGSEEGEREFFFFPERDGEEEEVRERGFFCREEGEEDEDVSTVSVRNEKTRRNVVVE